MTLRPGTRIELHGTPAFPGFPGVAPERAVIARPRKINLPMRDGYHLVKFADGGMLCVHEGGFRLVAEIDAARPAEEFCSVDSGWHRTRLLNGRVV